MGIDQDDDTSYDTDEFPKPVLLDWVTDADVCARCDEPL